MEIDINRLMMEFELLLKESNREHINPQVKELSIDDLKPVADLVARARAIYLKQLYQLAQQYQGKDELPSLQEMDELAALRKRFLELVEGSKSFETAIQRGYLDVKHQNSD